ncbi:MAG: alpha/beta fold hydrolase [archaeon]
MNRNVYEYSKGDGKLFLEKMEFQWKNFCDNVSCLGKTKKVMDEMNAESIDKIRRNGGELTIWIHGIFQNYHRFLKSTVELFGERDVTIISVGYNYFSSTEEAAKEISFKINDLMRKARVNKINLIGVSYGGCVVRHYVEYLGGHKKVNKLVSVCSPYSGLSKKSVAHRMTKFAGNNKDITEDIFYRNSCRNHFVIHALNDWCIGEQKILCPEVRQMFVRGGHNPSANDPRKLELILKILKGEIS